MLFSLLASIIATVIDMLLVSVVGFGFVYILYYLAVFIPTLAVGARRLHDINKSGWLQLLVFIPLAGLILIFWWAKESDPEENQYGPYKP